jgi:hypothetical protein
MAKYWYNLHFKVARISFYIGKKQGKIDENKPKFSKESA